MIEPAEGGGLKALVTGAAGSPAPGSPRSCWSAATRWSASTAGARGPRGLALLGIDGEVADEAGDLPTPSASARCWSGTGPTPSFTWPRRRSSATALDSPVPTFQSNIEGTWNLMEAAPRIGGRSGWWSPPRTRPTARTRCCPTPRTRALQPIYPYDVSKAAADMIARSYWHTYELPVAVTRFANIYGGGDLNFSRLIPETVSAVIDGRRPVIRSDGSPERDFLYVEDVARAYVAIAEALAEGRGAGEAFNAGWGHPNSVREVVELICELAGAEVEPDIRGEGNPEGEIDRQFLDSTKIREVTGWQPQVDLREGLGRTIEWYRAHPEARAPAPS